MRKIDNYFDHIPNGLWFSDLVVTHYKPEKISILQRILRDSRVSERYYKGNGAVKTKLLYIYAHCCAFCEARLNKYDDIEHFRPKHEITGVNTKGYYWLAVEWSNLLIACKVCNSDYKKNHFPIAGTRVTAPASVDFNNTTSVYDFFRRNHICSSELQSEQPLLLHPVLDNPDDYLFFEMNGTVSSKNNNLKGLTSIQYYGLSDWENREILIQDRKKIIEDVRTKVYHFVDSYVNDERLYQDLLELHINLIRKIESKRPFSAVRCSCLANFKTFFIDCFTGEQEDKLKRAYDRVINNLA